MPTLKAVIVEDDPGHAESLQEALAKLPGGIEVMAVCTGVNEAFEKITQCAPDIVFLDIELDRGENGFDLLQRFSDPDFSVIFTTQHSSNNNILNALRASALDFLTKAVKPEELAKAVGRYKLVKGKDPIKALQDNIDWMKVLMIRRTEGLSRLEIDSIRYATSDGAYTTFHLCRPVDGKSEYLTSVRIGEWAETLTRSDLFRCHREWMVNARYCQRFKAEGRGGYFILDNGMKIAVSESYKSDAESRFRSYRKRNS